HSRRHPRHARRRVRDRRRRRAPAAPRQGRRRGHRAHLRGLTEGAVSTEHPDSTGLRDALLRRPELVAGFVDPIAQIDGLPTREQISNIVVIGMGQAALAGDLVDAVAGPFTSVPIVLHRGYELPSFVAPDSLVIALSVSGTTDETIEATQAAYEAGAPLLSVTRADGHLAELVDAWG